jgi:hypothetical protein
MANTATVRNAGGLRATFAGSKTGQDDAPFVFVKVGDEDLPRAFTGCQGLIAPHSAYSGRDQEIS